jgi:molybdenum cofactor cytidylyltransferase
MHGVVDRVIIVTGWQAGRLQALLAGRQGVTLVHNAGYRAGMFSSVKVGLAQVRAARFFLLPGDLPLIGQGVYERLLEASGEIVIPTFEGRRGHPVCMSSQLSPEILAQADDSNLRAYIQRKGYHTVEVEEEGILLDLDTPEDYERLQARIAAQNG